MKTLRVPLALLLLTGSFAFGQAPVPDAGAATETAPASLRRTPQELEQLLAPIALYPDALIAIILPASTAPADIVLAARTLRDDPNDRSQIEHRAWDESVKSLTNYPEVLKWMDENLQWTKQVGEAFAVQSADVMQAVQRLREQARANGTLVDTPQQQVIAEPEVIRIVPAQPDVIYVPYYQPEVVFVDRPVFYSQPFLTFGIGVPVGSWLAFDCDWRRHTIWVGDRHRHWVGQDWHRPVVPLGPTYSSPHFARAPEVRQWHPSAAATRTVVVMARNPQPPPIVRPAPINRVTAPGFVSRGGLSTDPRRAPPAQTFPAQTASADTQAPTQTRRSGPGAYRGTPAAQNPSTVVTASPATSATVAPTTAFAPPVASTTTPPAQTTAQRRGGTEWRDRTDNHPHTYSRTGNNSTAYTPTPVQSSAPAQIVPPANPPAVQTYSRAYYAPPPPANNVAVAAPPVMRHTAPVVVAPQSAPAPAPAPAPQAAPAPAQPAPANNAAPSTGHRGARRNVNEN